MFKIECFVEDKRLAEALKALAGVVRGMPSVVPVMNVEDERTGLKAKSNGSNLIQVFADHVVSDKITSFTPKDVQAWLVKQGRSKLSSNYICKNLVKNGFVKRVGKSSNSTYHVRPK